MKMKRFFALVLTLAMLLSLLTACRQGLTVPEISVDGDGALTILNPNANQYYEISVYGETAAILPIANLEGFVVPTDAEVKVRGVDPGSNAVSEWAVWTPDPAALATDPNIPAIDPNAPEAYVDPTLKKLQSPQVELSATGHATVTSPDGAEEFAIIYPELGIREGFYSGENVIPNTPFQICAVANGDMPDYAPSDPTEEMIFRAESITFSATENTIDNLQKNEDGSYTMTAYSNLGKAYRFKLEGSITPAENAWGTLGEKSVFYTLDALKGILSLNVDADALAAAEWSRAPGYELDGSDSVESAGDMDVWQCITGGAGLTKREDFFSNFYAIGDPNRMSGDAITLTSWTLYFNGVETEFDHATTHDFFYQAIFLPGSPYITSSRLKGMEYVLRLYFRNGQTLSTPVDYSENTQADALLNAAGQEITDTENYHLQPGDKILVTLASGLQTEVPLVKETVSTAKTVNEIRPQTFSQTVGTLNALVIPISWADQQDRANEQNMQTIYNALGNVMDASGKVTTYTTGNPEEPTMSAYFAAASYGQLTVNSFVTDWYAYPETYDTMRDIIPPQDWHVEIMDWVKQTYPDLDLQQFDLDQDGILDEVIYINTGDMDGYKSYVRDSLAGAHRTVYTYGEEESFLRQWEDPRLYHFVNINLGFLSPNQKVCLPEEVQTQVLIHEFSHSLGVWDYYDTGSKGQSYLGGYDMQDSNVGDWNVYSKYAAGWLTPTVVDGSKETAEYTLRSSALYGDALLIPAAGYNYNGTPFDEYILVDLFTPEGLHTYDSKAYGLQDSVGVRMYHVSDLMEARTGDDLKQTYTFGMMQHRNNSDNIWSELFGYHQLEILSATGKNRFLKGKSFGAKDLFTEGDSFTAEEFDAFFYDGKMDSGMDFGYTVTVKSITQVNGEYVATITVTRK